MGLEGIVSKRIGSRCRSGSSLDWIKSNNPALHASDLRSQWYHAVVAPDATVALVEVNVREGVDTGLVKARVVQRTRVIFRGDSVAVDDMTGPGAWTRECFPRSPCGALPQSLVWLAGAGDSPRGGGGAGLGESGLLQSERRRGPESAARRS